MLQNMQLDIAIESAPNLMLQTSYTQDLQAEVDLNVRGTAARPSLLGRVSVREGEINFFGNKYIINRGEVNFYNPVRIEPVIDVDLQTRARGVDVNISLSGTLNKMNTSFRSDPPMSSTDIIALLAVGRSPDQVQSLAGGQTVSNQNYLETGANTLIGQAVANPVSSRLQRFFGVSKLKIDPMLQGLEGTPQARLTLEQQISRNITLTYVTNLSNAQQQIVRLEWAINREWSVVAVRDENGIFGVDFAWKRRFR
jgi:translocation and assembly module TamB